MAAEGPLEIAHRTRTLPLADRQPACALVDRAIRRQETGADQLHQPHPGVGPYERVKFEEPKLGRRQKRPHDFVADPTPRNVVPDVW